MHLSSILKEYGVDIKKTKLVRHPLNKTDIRDVYERGMIEAYQSSQSKNCFDNCKYIASFVGTTGTEAKFIGLYEIVDTIDGLEVMKHMPEGYPYPDHFDDTHRFYVMKKLETMSDMDNKLIIDWGKGALAWFQWAENDKEVLSIASRDEVPFPGYESLILSYKEDKKDLWQTGNTYIRKEHIICAPICTLASWWRSTLRLMRTESSRA
jgi:hypothetical protein